MKDLFWGRHVGWKDEQHLAMKFSSHTVLAVPCCPSFQNAVEHLGFGQICSLLIHPTKISWMHTVSEGYNRTAYGTWAWPLLSIAVVRWGGSHSLCNPTNNKWKIAMVMSALESYVGLWSMEQGRIDLVSSGMELKHERLSQGSIWVAGPWGSCGSQRTSVCQMTVLVFDAGTQSPQGRRCHKEEGVTWETAGTSWNPYGLTGTCVGVWYFWPWWCVMELDTHIPHLHEGGSRRM